VGLVLAPAVPPAPSIRGLYPDTIFRAATIQRVTGYGVVVLALGSLVLTLRKRSRYFSSRSVTGLRVLHAALGAAAVACLSCHTGLRLGERLNRLLALDFLAAAALGGVAAALEDPSAPASLRAVAARAHVLVLLPLPVLVALHVLVAHYF
jgi:nitrite reductase (NADH) large subunit